MLGNGRDLHQIIINYIFFQPSMKNESNVNQVEFAAWGLEPRSLKLSQRQRIEYVDSYG